MTTALLPALRLKFLSRQCSRLTVEQADDPCDSVRKGAAVPGVKILSVAARAEHAIHDTEAALPMIRMQSTASF